MKKSETEKTLRNELSRFSVLSYDRNLVAAKGGNISARIPDRNEILITPSGISLKDITPENILKVDEEGNVIDKKSSLKPSKETPFHSAIYKNRSEINAVFHLHPPYATGLSLSRKPLPMIIAPAMVNLKEVPLIDFALMGTPELHRMVDEGIKKYKEAKAFLLKQHGIIAMGVDIPSAFYTADLVEDCAKVAFISSMIKNKE
jgi:ribulose-5-phosphate 4-epimerase/fuculose-1-phosphate aldolase